jgi:hypothetical protein
MSQIPLDIFQSVESFDAKNFCSCQSLGMDGRDLEPLGLTVRLMDVAVGNSLSNQVVLNIGADDTVFFLNQQAAVHTVDDNAFNMQNLKSAVRPIPNHVYFSYQQHVGDFSSSVCFLAQMGVRIDLPGSSTCADSTFRCPFKEDSALNQLLHDGVDLLHVKCDGCEYALLLYLTSSGLIRRVSRINAAIKNLPGHDSLRCQLHAALLRTHAPTYCTDVWQGWALRDTPLPRTPAAVPAAPPPPQPSPPACLPTVLLLGDSVDRYIVRAYCAQRNGTVDDWSGAMFVYKAEEPASGSAACRLPGGVLAHLHLFGSNRTGPYRDNIASSWSVLPSPGPLGLAATFLLSLRVGPSDTRMVRAWPALLTATVRKGLLGQLEIERPGGSESGPN